MMTLSELLAFLQDVELRSSASESLTIVEDSLAALKADAVKRGDQEFAKRIWCYETILKIQKKYLEAFTCMKSDAYYESWCALERVEVYLAHLERHFDIENTPDEFQLSYIKTHTERFQTLFPYKFFGSPGMVYLEKRCSICGAIVKLRDWCGHVSGEIYDGEMCGREITNVDILEISLVTEPAQKYSVLFLSDPKTGKQRDQYNYSHVKYVVGGLRRPFDAWEINWTKTRHPHSRFASVKRNDDCPCGSGKKYKLCCLREEGVLRPHALINFLVLPPNDYPSFTYSE